MNKIPSTAADILIKVRITPFGHPPSEEVRLSLASRMDSLLSAGYEMDDVLGLIVPLLLEGKVRLDLDGGGSERMEMASEWLRIPRPAALAIFEEYATKKKDAPQPTRRRHCDTVLISLPKKA